MKIDIGVYKIQKEIQRNTRQIDVLMNQAAVLEARNEELKRKLEADG